MFCLSVCLSVCLSAVCGALIALRAEGGCSVCLSERMSACALTHVKHRSSVHPPAEPSACWWSPDLSIYPCR
jgi:hypothetical protein